MSALTVRSCLLDICEPYKGVLSDAFGVFWNGSGLYPGVLETFDQLVRQGKIVVILSNSTALGEKEEAKYAKQGLVKGTHYHEMITSGEVAKAIFSQQDLPFQVKNQNFWVFGDDHALYGSPHEKIFEKSPFKRTTSLQEAGFIYLGIPNINGEDQTDPQVFEERLRVLLETGLTMVCANPDRFVKEGDPACQVVRQGQIAKMYEQMGGRVYYIGKPSLHVYRLVEALFQSRGTSSLQEVIMVGDNPETDIEGACNAGMASALVTTTGISGDGVKAAGLESYYDQLPLLQRPTHLIEAFALPPSR